MSEGAPGEPVSGSYYDRPLLKEPVWIWSVPVYFFAGGAAGALSTLAAVARLWGERDSALVRRARMLSAALHGAGVVLLVIDLGRPARFLNMLRVFRPTSPLSVGSWVLAGSAPSTLGSLVVPGAAGDALGAASGLLGLPMTCYTAVVLAGTAIPAWQAGRTALPVCFVGSSMSAAAGLLELTGIDDEAVRGFGRAGAVLELGGLAALVGAASREGRAGRAYRRGPAGAVLSVAGGAAAAGALLSRSRSRRRRVAGACLSVAASIAMRTGVVLAGTSSSRDPRASFEPQRRRLADPEPAGSTDLH